MQYERLLLPFARDGRRVDRILAAFEFICADGGFDLKDLMVSQSVPPALRFSAAIEHRDGVSIATIHFRLQQDLLTPWLQGAAMAKA